MVDASPTFPDVLRQLKDWLKKHDLLDEDGEGLKNAMWVTDGVSLSTPSHAMINDTFQAGA